MAYVTMTAAEINEIKQKIKNEFARRNGYGSLEQYSNNNYDFIEEPQQGLLITAEHGQKTIDLLLQIEDIPDTEFVIQGNLIPPGFEYTQITNALDEWAAEDMEGPSSSCRGACTGLCVGTCYGACTGCMDQCTGSCSDECSLGCGTSCIGEAEASCQGCYASCISTTCSFRWLVFYCTRYDS